MRTKLHSLLVCLVAMKLFAGERAGAQEMAMPAPMIGSVSLPAKGADTDPVYQSASTKRMAERLRSVFAATDWKLDPSKPGERVRYYSEMLRTQKLALREDSVVRQQLAREMLGAGDNEGAVRQLEEVRRRWTAANEMIPAENAKELGRWLATAYLRLGEQENCAHMHGQGACVFPLRASAVHQMPRGAQGAVRELTALLERDAKDTEAQWLLNIAYMQLGKYPQDVPAKWVIPPARFKSDAALPEFAEVAAGAGIDITSHAGGVVVEDFDGDGWLDVMVTSSGPLDQMHLFHNNGDGTFRDVTRRAGLIGETGGLNIVLTDYNNDGKPDVLVLRGGWWGKQGCYPMSLLRNNGDGTFDDVTEEAGLLSMHPTQTAAWADFDGDGWLDVMVGHESTASDPHPSQLFRNNRDGTFTEVGGASGLADLGFVKGVAWGDFNNDGRPDLYVSVMYGKNRLFRNDGKGKFTDVTAMAGVALQSNSFATWFFDYDNDGWPDLFVAGYSTAGTADVGAFEIGLPNHAEFPKLYRNMHDGTFKDVTAAMHMNRAILPMGANFGDLDNDGWLDVYLGTGDSTYQALLPNRMFRNAGGQRFEDVTTAGGFGHLQKGHGIVFADLRNVGLEDVFEEMGGAQTGDSYQSALYQNPGNGNHWVTVMLEGVKTNRAAFGARIDVTVKSGSGARHIYRTVGYGSSFGGNPLRQHVGIGTADRVEEIAVTWPVTGIVERIRGVQADRTYRMREGSGKLVPVVLH
ncbi:CRTAC1 family protein [Granulicella sibirica]|uniref:ASPIC/UnbV domain protein n=1 Tax=Granulicella sibirica TaxID=2479048 RepID=A0A4Q0SZ25_9BACT|nr:CRTAC1 family protein [Granulicella sibirica]RXH54316.1 ASPIC/UnbV domain protein [Granulicella sibirica]